jgi:hypothetical protein
MTRRDRDLFGLELKKLGLGGALVSYLKINFRLGPNAPWAGPGKILQLRPVQTSIPRRKNPKHSHIHYGHTYNIPWRHLLEDHNRHFHRHGDICVHICDFNRQQCEFSWYGKSSGYLTPCDWHICSLVAPQARSTRETRFRLLAIMWRLFGVKRLAPKIHAYSNVHSSAKQI